MITYPKETITKTMAGAKVTVFYMGLLKDSNHLPFAGQFPTHFNEHNAYTLTSIAKTTIPQWMKSFNNLTPIIKHLNYDPKYSNHC
jgi:hypothetical protein